MTMFQLQCFMAMVNNGVEQKAADTLNISQSTLSKAISSLEAELNIKLFNRTGRRLELNEQGKLFYKYIFEATEVINEGADIVSSLSKDMLGTITIRSNVYSGILSNCISSYCIKNPHVNFRFKLDKASDIKAAAYLNEQDTSDIMLAHAIPDMNLEPQSDDFPVKKKILDNEYLLVVSPKYIKFPEQKTTVKIEELANCTFILMNNAFIPNSTEFRLWNSILASLGTFPIRIIEVSDLVHKLSFLSSGSGIAFLPDVCIHFAKKYDPSLRTFKVEGVNLKQHIILARHRRNSMSSQAIDFWNHAMNHFGLAYDKED